MVSEPDERMTLDAIERSLGDAFDALRPLPDLPAIRALRMKAEACKSAIALLESTPLSEEARALASEVLQLSADARVLQNALVCRPSRVRRRRT